MTAVQALDWETAARYLLQAIEEAQGSARGQIPAEVRGLLHRVLERSGAWPEVLAQAEPVTQALHALREGRRWEALEQALGLLERDLPLALAAGTLADLPALGHEAQRGRELDAAVRSRLQMAERMAGAGRVAQALEQLLAGAEEDQDTEHYAALAGAARPLLQQVVEPRNGHALSLLRCSALRARLGVLCHLAGLSDESGAGEPV
jgi:hypothetical protein